MDCNKAEKFDFVSFLATQPLAAFLHGMLSSASTPPLALTPLRISHQPILEALFPDVWECAGLREESLLKSLLG